MDSDFRPAKRPESLRSTQDKQTVKATPDQETFRTPDEVAADDQIGQTASNVDLPVDATAKKDGKLKDLKEKLHLQWPPGKKEWVASLIIIVFCGSTTAFILSHTGAKPVAHATQVKKVKPQPPKPTTVQSTLTGLQVDPSVNTRPVTGIMIENSLDARPQAGLGEAGVVFEAIAEGGITRFLALYQDTAPGFIGPVRSARPYYIQWAMGFDAGYAHVGGSPEALNDIKAWSVKDLDQFHNSGAYQRVSSRAAPHNVYTGIDKLNQLETSKGYTTSTYTGFARAKKANPAKTPNATKIDFKTSGPLYNAHYDYNATTNTYNRSEGGSPHVDINTNTQISPSVVIGLVVPYGFKSDGYHSDYQVNGSGQAFIFQDGIVIPATWTKTSEKSQITFTDAAGKTVNLSPGRTWITAVASADKVAYAQ